MSELEINDFFISYKRKDASAFAENLAKSLRDHKYNVWFDEFTLKPGDSIISEIEKGLNSSLMFILIISENYFQGWSDQERKTSFHLFLSKKRKIVPVWYKVSSEFVSDVAPFLSDIKAIQIDDDSDLSITKVTDSLRQLLSPGEQVMKLKELMIRALLKKVPHDPNLKIFVAVFDGDTAMLEEAIEEGADVNITDTTIMQYYHKLLVKLGFSGALAKLLILQHKQTQ